MSVHLIAGISTTETMIVCRVWVCKKRKRKVFASEARFPQRSWVQREYTKN